MDRCEWWCPSEPWAAWGLLFVLGALTLLPGLSTLPVVDRDEPRFAHATIEMMDRGEWIIPYFNDAYRFDKPPLTYWWMRVNYWIFGRNELGARMHSVLSALACAGVLFAWGRQLFDRAIGWWAAVGWLTCLQVLIHGRIALADMPMVLAILVAQWSLWRILVENSRERRWWWALWLSMGLGFLAKGPIAWLVPLLTWGLFAVFGRVGHRWHFRGRDWLAGVALVLGLVAAWGIPALVLTQGAYFDIGIGKHVVERGMGEFNARSWNPAFYLVMFVFLFPWSGGLPRAVRRGWKDLGKGRFLVLWLLVPILVFTFYQTQLPHYVLPGYGAALLLIFGFLRPGDLLAGWFPRVLAGLIGGLGVAVLGVALISQPAPELEHFRYALGSLGLALVSLTALWWSAGRQHLWGLAAAVLVLAVSLGAIGRNLRTDHLSLELAEVIEAEPGATCVGLGYAEGSLIYYTDLFWEFPRREAQTDIGERIARGEVDVVVFERRFWDFQNRRGFSLWHLLWSGDESRFRENKVARLIPETVPNGWRREVHRGLNLGRFIWSEVEVWQRTASAPTDAEG